LDDTIRRRVVAALSAEEHNVRGTETTIGRVPPRSRVRMMAFA